VQQIHAYAADSHSARLGYSRRPRLIVVIPANGLDRRQRAQLVKHRRGADISCVQDEIRALEECSRFGSQQSVGIGDESDADGAAMFR
jgi:hypothetical protein